MGTANQYCSNRFDVVGDRCKIADKDCKRTGCIYAEHVTCCVVDSDTCFPRER